MNGQEIAPLAGGEMCEGCRAFMLRLLDARIRKILEVGRDEEDEDLGQSHCFHLTELQRILEGKTTCGVYDDYGAAFLKPSPIAPAMIQPGSRVRYRFAGRDTGTVVKRCRATSKSGDWYVRWDHDPHGPRLLATWEENMEELPDHQPSPHTASVSSAEPL
jgi:hypothetical protein